MQNILPQASMQNIILALAVLWYHVKTAWMTLWQPQRMTAMIIVAIALAYSFNPQGTGAEFLNDTYLQLGFYIDPTAYAVLASMLAGLLFKTGRDEHYLVYWTLSAPLAIHIVYMASLFLAGNISFLPTVLYTIVYVGNGVAFQSSSRARRPYIRTLYAMINNDPRQLALDYMTALQKASR